MNEQPEALRLAEDCEYSAELWANEIDTRLKAAALLRSQHARIERLEKALANLLAYTERNECRHEETHRGGAIWTICDQCGMQWADDKGGFKSYAEPSQITNAHQALEQQ